MRSLNELCLAINPALFPLKLGLERQIEVAFRKIDAIGYLQASIFCTIKLKRREKKKCNNFTVNACKGAIRVCSHHRQVIGKAITLKWNASRPISDPPLLCCKLFEYKYGRKLISSKTFPSVLSSLLLVSHVILLILYCTVLLHIFSCFFCIFT